MNNSSGDTPNLTLSVIDDTITDDTALTIAALAQGCFALASGASCTIDTSVATDLSDVAGDITNNVTATYVVGTRQQLDERWWRYLRYHRTLMGTSAA